MLEAFKHAGEALPAGSPAAGGPFAGPRKPSEEEIAEAKLPPPPPIPDVDTDIPKATWSEVLNEFPSWLPAALGVLVVLVLGILIGRASVGDAVQASSGESTGSEERFVPANGRFEDSVDEGGRQRILPEDLDQRSSASSPLYDPENIYTVILITYSSSDYSQDLAWATYDWLSDLGYPVWQPAFDLGNEEQVLLLAGAAPLRSDLEELVAEIRQEKSADDKSPFEGAYIVEIASHIDLWRDR
ncbi:MAG: hypothetical protein ACI8QS_002015 [Planctomycetota bacterium]|jgi:hypothetical protein